MPVEENKQAHHRAMKLLAETDPRTGFPKYTMEQIGDHVGVAASTISRWAKNAPKGEANDNG